MKKTLLVFSFLITIIVISLGELKAQPQYNFSAAAVLYTPIGGGTPFNWRVTANPNDEDFTFPTPIAGIGAAGFLVPFRYNGVPFSEIQVSCNGFLKFVNSATGDTLSTSKTTGATNKLTAYTRNILAPLWDDNAVINEIADIDYQFQGLGTPIEMLVIEWRNVKWNYNALAPVTMFQVRLIENHQLNIHMIEFHYGPLLAAPNSPSASIGMNDGTPISSTTSGTEATGTFLSINCGGVAGARTYHRSYGYEYLGITATSVPDPNTVFQFIPPQPPNNIPLLGVYTVGGVPAPNNFTTLSDAAEALNLRGIAGPVILNLWPGPSWDPGIPAPVWDDIFHLIPIVGSNPFNTITVQVDPAYGGQVTIAPRNGTSSTSAPNATTGDAMIRLDGTSYVSITGVNGRINLINNTQNTSRTTQYDMGIFLGNAIVTTFNTQSIVTGARFNLFDRLYIDMNNGILAQQPAPDNNPGLIGIRFGTNGPNADINQTNSFNTIKDCEIVDFYRSAVYMYGFSSAVPDISNTITGTFEQSSSLFHDANLTVSIQDCRAIEAYAQKDLLIENTSIYNIIATALTSNGTWGIRINPASTDGTSGTCTVRYCNINNIENQGAQVTSGFACGIEITSPYHEGRVEVYNNKVYDIFSSGSTTSRALGMQFSLGANGNSYLNVYNNYIYDLRAPRSTSSPSVRGLDIQSPNNVLTAGVYYNTIYLEGAQPVTVNSHYSTCLYFGQFTTSSLDLRNNILVTDASAGVAGTGITTCIWAPSNANLLRLALTTNNNLYWTNVPPTPNRPIAYDGTVPFVTLANYQNAVATGGLGGPRDDQAVTEMPPFIQPVNPIIGGIPQDLHLNPAIPSQAESGALPVSGPPPIPAITDDWDGSFPPNFRNPNFPDIGADEYPGLLVADALPPRIFYTPIPNQNSLVPPILIAQITDRSGIPPGTPILWHKRTIDAAFVAVPGIPGPGPNDYTFPLSYGFPAPPPAIGDVIQYYIGAQDATVGPNVGTNPSGGGGLPPGVLPPPIFNTFSIDSVPVPGGTYTVGINKFNQLIGKNLYSKTFTKIVKEKVRAERNIEATIPQSNGSELNDLSLTVPGIDRDYDFDSTKFSPTEFVWRDVEREYIELMDGDEIYKGPHYIDVTIDDLKHVGINTEGMENVRGWFTTLTAALNEINRRGIAGAITLSLVDNVYNAETYPLELNSVAGVSGANTITIKPASGASPVFTTSAGATGVAMLKIINTSYVTIDGSNTSGGSTRDLTFNNIRTGAGQGIWVGSLGTTPLTQIEISNCNVYTGETSGSTPIIISDGTTAGSSGYFSNIKIKNNLIQKGRQGIYLNGGIIPQYGSNIYIADNLLNSSGANALKLYGIYVQGCNNVVVSNNDIGNFESTSYENDRGIWIAAGTINAIVEKNRVHDLNSTTFSSNVGNGGNGIVVSSSSLSCNNVIRNNFIYNILGFGSSTVNQNPLAIYIYGAQTGLSIYHNSIYLNGSTLKTATATATAAFSCGVCVSSGTYADVRNNIIYNGLGQDPTSPGSTNGAMGVFAFQSLAQFTNLDNNCYYMVSTFGSKSFGHVNGLGYLGFNQTFSTWQSNSSRDINSYNANPQYINPSVGNLHISTTLGTPCESGGASIGVADDIDGDIRNAFTPDIGADEFNGTKYSLTLTALIDGFYNTLTGPYKMVPDTVKIYLRNTSSPYTIIDSAIGVLDTAGICTFKLTNPVIGTAYYIQVNHRNSIETWSKSGGENFNTYAFGYNLTSAQSQAYNGNMKLKNSKWCIYGGEIANNDQYIDGDDVTAAYNAQGASGYVIQDVTGDDYVDGDDVTLTYNNQGVGVTNPIVGLKAIKPKTSNQQNKKMETK